MRLLIAIVVWSAALAGAVLLSSTVAGSIPHKPTTVTTTSASSASGSGGTSTSSAASRAPVDPSTIKATDRLSLFRASNFARALAQVRHQIGNDARIEDFALYPGYVSLTAVRGSGQTVFYVDANGRSSRTDTGGASGALSVFRLARVQSSAPALLTRRIATAAHIRASRLHYMVAQSDPITHRFRWLVYTVQGTPVEYFEASGATGPLLEYRENSGTGLQPVSG